MNTPNYTPHKKAAWVAGVALVIVSISGYFMGLQQTLSRISKTPFPEAPPAAEAGHLDETDAGEVPTVVSYREISRKQTGPNARFRSDLRDLLQERGSDRLDNVTEQERLAALAERRDRRAYDGAPPVVPHPIAQDSAASCLACHGDGLKIKDRVASKVSHAHYSSCTQCHVAASGTQLAISAQELREAIAENSFGGLVPPTHGTRAWEGAPPTIPHPTAMRSDCLSCHGPTGLFGLRTPHPERQSCTQCHAPNADMEQREFQLSIALSERFFSTNSLPLSEQFP